MHSWRPGVSESQTSTCHPEYCFPDQTPLPPKEEQRRDTVSHPGMTRVCILKVGVRVGVKKVGRCRGVSDKVLSDLICHCSNVIFIPKQA